MSVNYNLPENHAERRAYVTLVLVHLHGMFDLRRFLHAGIIWESFGSIVLLPVSNLKKNTNNCYFHLQVYEISYLLNFSVPLGFHIVEYHH